MDSMKAPLESREQQVLVAWLIREGYFVYSIPNHQGMKKHEGAVPGIPDLQIALDGGKVLWIEMKRRKGGVLSPAQIKVHAMLRALGHTVILALGAKDAREQILEAIT